MRRLTFPTAALLVLSACSRSEDCGPYVFDPVHRFCICGDGGTFNPDAEMCEWPVDAQVIETDAPDAAVEPDAPIDGGCEGLLGTREHCSACGDRCAWRCESAELGCDDPATVAISDQHVCLATTLGNVHCWGENFEGQLGTGPERPVLAPTAVAGVSEVVEVVATTRLFAEATTCARTRSGGVWCWGSNREGSLGEGSGTTQTAPVALPTLASGVTALAARSTEVCAIHGGVLKCWGAGVIYPSMVAGLSGREPTDVALGAGHECIISGSRLLCRGENGEGQLGIGSTTASTSWVEVELPAPVTDVAAGASHTCAIANDQLFCWGANRDGEVGDPTVVDRTTWPVAIGTSSVARQVRAAGSGTCVTLADGSAACWGSNFAGRIGDGTILDRHAPTVVAGLTRVREIATGVGTTCAITDARELYCWGLRPVGDGTAIDRLVPTLVSMP